MSVGKKTVGYVASAAAIAALIIVASTLYLGFPVLPQGRGTTSKPITSIAGPQSLLLVRLTDPPHVPVGTKSLNLTYTSLSLLVGEPSSQGGKLTTTTVTIAASGGSATFNLLKLQNISQTIASAKLPNGSVVFSAALTISGIKIDVGGTTSPVTLAAGGSTLTVVISKPTALSGTNVALLQLNPVVVDTPTGYQLIPSAVGVLRQSQGEGEENVGSQHQLTKEDDSELQSAHGSVTANLVALSVSDDSTTVTVQVKNTGDASLVLNAIGLKGDFTAVGVGCAGTTGTSTTSTTTTSTTETSHGSESQTTHTSESKGGENRCGPSEHMNEVVFVPVIPAGSTATTSATTSAACTSGQMRLVSGDSEHEAEGRGLALNPGQCFSLTFSGKITFGEAPFVLVPSTASGQAYIVHIIASNEANMKLSCALPLSATSCKVLTQSESGENELEETEENELEESD